MAKPRSAGAAGAMILVSVGLLVLPGAWTGAARTTLQAGLAPFRSVGTALGRGARSAAFFLDRLPPSDQLVRDLEFEQSKSRQYQEKLTRLQAQLESLAAARRLFKDPKLVLRPASVILPSDSTPWRRSMVVAAGTGDGVRPGQPVVWHGHFVGRVAECGPLASRVCLLIDPEMKIGAAAVPRSGESAPAPQGRDVGILEGTGEPAASLKWVAPDVAAEEGATVVTTPDPYRGIPAGLLLGRIRGVSRARSPLPRVQVEPFLNLRALESVLIVIRAEE